MHIQTRDISLVTLICPSLKEEFKTKYKILSISGHQFRCSVADSFTTCTMHDIIANLLYINISEVKFIFVIWCCPSFKTRFHLQNVSQFWHGFIAMSFWCDIFGIFSAVNISQVALVL